MATRHQQEGAIDPAAGAPGTAPRAGSVRVAQPPLSRTPYAAVLLVGLGGLFTGVTGPLLSAFIPPLVRDAVGEHRTAIGAIMAIDNVLLLLLVPWAGAASDRATARGLLFVPVVPS